MESSPIKRGVAAKSFEFDNEARWFQILLKCTEFPSVNSCHGINTKTRVVFDQPWVVEFRGEIKDQLIFIDPRKNCPWIDNRSIYYLYIKFIMKDKFWSRDYDNMIKIFQDEITRAININDARIVEGRQFKAYRPGDSEYALVRFGVSDYNYNEFSDGY